MAELLLGIDLGTTVLKAAAYDVRSGKASGQALQRLPIETGPDGKREQDPTLLDRAFAKVIRDLRRQLGTDWKYVSGIGLAAQGGSGVVADRATGKPLSPMYLWNDMRFGPHLPGISAQKPASYWRDLAWRDGAGWGLARIDWLRSKNPRLICERNIYAGAGDYLYRKLTGVWRQDAGNALQTGCYNVARRGLDREPLDLIGVTPEFVSPMREGHGTHPLSKEGAKLLGLPRETPVAGPYMDHEAGYLAAAKLSARPLQFSLGTAWVGNFVLPTDARWSSSFQLVIPAPVTDGWLVVQPLLTGNVTWDWGMETLLDRNRKKAIARLDGIFAERLLPPEHLAALPWLNMPNALWPERIGAGTYFGISAATTREDLLRALAAGMVYEAARVFNQVTASSAVDAAILAGGASKGVFFQQLLAAVFDPLPVRVLREEDWAGTRGALHAFSDKVSSATATKTLLPRSKFHDQIRAGYDRYLQLFDRLYGQVPAGGAFRFNGNGAGAERTIRAGSGRDTARKPGLRGRT